MKHNEYIDIKSHEIAEWFVSNPMEYMEVAAKYNTPLRENTGIDDMAYIISNYGHTLDEVMPLMAFGELDVKAPYYWCDENRIISIYRNEEGFRRLMQLLGCKGTTRAKYIEFIADFISNAVLTGMV